MKRVLGRFGWWELVPVAGISLVFAVYLTWPLAAQMGTHAADPADSLDGLYSAYVQAWVTRALTSNPGRLFDMNMFYPATNTLALSENFIGNQPIFAPVYAATKNPLLASNVVILTSFLLCAVSMYLLVRYLAGSPWAAAIAGFVYAFAPARIHQLGHMQLLSMQWMPLIVLFLLRFLAEKRVGSLIGLSISVLMQFLCSLYLGYVAMVIALAFFLGVVLGQRHLLTRAASASLIASALAVGLLLYPVVRPYRALQREGVLRPDDEIVIGASASPIASYLNAGYGPHFLYGHSLARFQSKDLDWEKHLFPGFLPVLLSIAAVAFQLRSPRGDPLIHSKSEANTSSGDARRREQLAPGTVVAAVLTVGLGYVLSLGPYLRINDQPSHLRMPLFWLRELLPGLGGFRVPARFALAVVFGLAVLTSVGFLGLLRVAESWPIFRHWLARAAVTAVAVSFLSLEFNFTPPRLEAAMGPANVAPVYRWLASQPPGSPTLELPMTLDEEGGPEPYEAAQYVYASAYHWQPLVNGYSSYAPRAYEEMLQLALDLPSHQAVEALGSRGLRYVILHTDDLPADKVLHWQSLPAPAGLRKVQEFGDTVVYEVQAERDAFR
ncbi:MAG TPA: hypothetical protein VHM88_06535 [Candidatus Acidoferrales bacterium]|nr:hypothetical protein [Candidatus Acidoferrales bacterium]